MYMLLLITKCRKLLGISGHSNQKGINKISTSELISLSEQEIVDREKTSTYGQCCQGGYMEDAFVFIVQNKGIASKSTYPYSAADGACNKNIEASHAAKISGYEKVPTISEVALVKAVPGQPVSVSIDASGMDFQFYSSGVFTGECGTDLDHGATTVVYGKTSNGTNYWLVRILGGLVGVWKGTL